MKNYVLLFILVLLLTSCFQNEEDFLFQGLYVEFDAVTYALDPSTFSIPLDDGQGEVAAQINLVGEHQNNDQEIAFSIDPESTAVEDEHFTLDELTTVIPANSSFGDITFTVLNADLPAGESVSLTLVLDGNDRLEPSENYRRQTYVIFGRE